MPLEKEVLSVKWYPKNNLTCKMQGQKSDIGGCSHRHNPCICIEIGERDVYILVVLYFVWVHATSIFFSEERRGQGIGSESSAIADAIAMVLWVRYRGAMCIAVQSCCSNSTWFWCGIKACTTGPWKVVPLEYRTKVVSWRSVSHTNFVGRKCTGLCPDLHEVGLRMGWNNSIKLVWARVRCEGY